ncbi:hypothetical protein [Mycolicibacterium sp.]|uniref:hypothetical protein n=1 Tax=Mycolicibacterium sp. TaxID=2320850 RepID=UPI0037C95F83
MTDHPTIPEPVNALVRLMLRSPLHRIMSHNTMVLSVTGRRSAKVYDVPVSYSVDGPDLVCFTDSPWWKNLRDAAPVTATIRGRRVRGRAEAVSGPAVAEHLGRHLHVVPRDARYHAVRLGAGRQPVAQDLLRAARTTAMIRVRLDETPTETT